MEEIKAEVISENVILELIEPEAKIKTVGEVTSNIAEVTEKALEMKEYYQGKIVKEEELKEAKKIRTKVNNAQKKIADYRKNIVAEFKKPIDLFEELAKQAEKALKETSDIIGAQCNAFDEKKKDKIREELKNYFNEYKASKKLGFTQYNDMNQSIGTSDISDKGVITKKKYKEISSFIDAIVKDVDTIETMEHSDEILVEYMTTRDLAESIKTVKDRHEKLEAVNQKSLLNVEKPTVIEPVEVEVLKAPIVENSTEELVTDKFEVICTEENLIELVKFMKERGIKYARID